MARNGVSTATFDRDCDRPVKSTSTQKKGRRPSGASIQAWTALPIRVTLSYAAPEFQNLLSRISTFVDSRCREVDLAEFPHVRRWYETMMARPGVQRGFAVKLS